MLAKPTERHVAAVTAATGIPVAASIEGLTKMM